ncbi:hypothetical protein C8R44DRAFT_903571, partial [Mycena epipterygia]
MTTDNVARDMLRITQKFGFEKLQYYGIPATFATLFPDKVGRILIDGAPHSLIIDPYYSHANLTIEATDTDKVLQSFFDGCVAAGPDLCAFYKPTAAEISDRLSALTSSIRAEPVPVITATSYGIVDYSLLRSTLFNSFYTPYSSFGSLAEGLAALERGNGTLLYFLSQEAPFRCDCSNDTAPFHLNGAEAATAVECGDAAKVTDSIEQLRAFYENTAKTSELAEFLVDSNRFSC